MGSVKGCFVCQIYYYQWERLYREATPWERELMKFTISTGIKMLERGVPGTEEALKPHLDAAVARWLKRHPRPAGDVQKGGAV